MDFTELLDRLASDHGLQLEAGEEGASLQLEQPGGRSQRVTLSTFEGEGRRYLRFLSPLGPPIAPPGRVLTNALDLNSSLTHGAFCLEQGQLAVVDTMELDRLDLDEAARILRYLGRMADTFERMNFGLDRG